jgi:type 1 glutamine amidotransferase
MTRKALFVLCLALAACGQSASKQPGTGGSGGEDGSGGAGAGTGGKPAGDAAASTGGSGGGATGGGGSGGGTGGATGGSGSPDAGTGIDSGAPPADAGAASNRVLIFTKTSGTVHVTGIAAAAASLKAALMAAGVMAETSMDATVFTEANLAKYAGVIMVSTSGAPFGTPGTAQIAALTAFVRGGGGLAGFHAASSTDYGPTGPFAALLGAETKDQGGGFRASDCYAEAGMHPAVAKLPTPWRVTNEEFYTFNGLNPDNKVVLRCNPATGTERIPISWVREEGAGRVFFTGLGHYAQIWGQGEQFFTGHALPGVLWTIKR